MRHADYGKKSGKYRSIGGCEIKFQEICVYPIGYTQMIGKII